MKHRLEIVVHGRGNAWPVPLGEDHPFYNRKDPLDLSNAAYSLQLMEADSVLSSVLIDAGHGTVQSLLSGDNRIPDCICLTHGHMDHTLSVDWVVQSFWRRHRKEKRYPIYATLPVYRFLLRSYPHLEELTEHRELEFGETFAPCQEMPFHLTTFPVYHGKSAVGASMLLFEDQGRSILFTGDLLTPLLRMEDYERLSGANVLIVDTNNRFPWPGTNHWSFAGTPGDPLKRNQGLEAFIKELSWEQVSAPHLQAGISEQNQVYLSQVQKEWNSAEQPLSILEFLRRTSPDQVLLVHYSGAEDGKYYEEKVLNSNGLQAWASESAMQNGISSRILVPGTGQRISLD